MCTWFLSPQPLPGRVSAGGGVTTGGVTTGGVGVVSGGDSSGWDVGADGVVSTTGGLAGGTTGGAGLGATGGVGVVGVAGVVGDVGVVGGAGVWVTGGTLGVGGVGIVRVRRAGRICAANCGFATGASRTVCCFVTIVRGVTTRTRCGAERTGAATERESGGGAGSVMTIVGRCWVPRKRVSAITPTAQAARNARSISFEVSARRQTARWSFGRVSRIDDGRGRAPPRPRAPMRSGARRRDPPTTSRRPS